MNRDVNIIIISCIVSRVIKYSLIRIFFKSFLRDATRYFLYILIIVDFDCNLCAADEIKVCTRNEKTGSMDTVMQQNLRDL